MGWPRVAIAFAAANHWLSGRAAKRPRLENVERRAREGWQGFFGDCQQCLSDTGCGVS